MPEFADLIRPAPPRRSGEEQEQIDRMAAFLAANPGFSIYPGTGFWQAHVRLASGSDTVTRWTLAGLMDELDRRYGPLGSGQ